MLWETYVKYPFVAGKMTVAELLPLHDDQEPTEVELC